MAKHFFLNGNKFVAILPHMFGSFAQGQGGRSAHSGCVALGMYTWPARALRETVI